MNNLTEYNKLFTADAVSMYTNINTKKALREIARYLRTQQHLFPDVPTSALMEALDLIMNNNIFTFGDTHWHQISGTAMGTPPAPPYATLFYSIHEAILLEEFPENLLYYKRFIDDIFGIWSVTDHETDQLTWQRFKQRLNDFDLEWECSD